MVWLFIEWMCGRKCGMRIESRIIDGILEAVLVDKEEILLIFPKITSETGELQVKIPEFVINYMEMINEDK
mgnify:CR=1 FL=1